MHREPTISDVARHAGVSKGLVSMTVNERPGVAETTRERILASVATLGWSPSPYARGLSLRSTFAVGLVLRRAASVLAADPYFPAFIAGVESVLSERGWTLMLTVVPGAAAEVAAYRQVGRRRVDGFFLTDLRAVDPRLALLGERAVPAVTIGRPFGATSPFPAVVQDDQPGVIAAVDHLIGLGHRRIGYVTGDQELVHGVRRRQAFTAALDAAGLPADLIAPGDFSAASGAAATADLRGRDDPPTAIVYGSDPMAIAGLGALQRAGISVPDQVSLVGFDGNELTAYLHPALSTIVTDPYRWGAEAARALLQRIERDSDDAAVAADLDRELPPARLVLRQSTAPPPNKF